MFLREAMERALEEKLDAVDSLIALHNPLQLLTELNVSAQVRKARPHRQAARAYPR